MPAAGGGQAGPGPRGGPLRRRESRRVPGGPARPAAAAPPPLAAARPAALALVTLLSFASRFHRLPEPPHVWYGPGRSRRGASARGRRAEPKARAVGGCPPPPGNSRLSSPRPAPSLAPFPSTRPPPHCPAGKGSVLVAGRRWDEGVLAGRATRKRCALWPARPRPPTPDPLSPLLWGRAAGRAPGLGEAVSGICVLQADF